MLCILHKRKEVNRLFTHRIVATFMRPKKQVYPKTIETVPDVMEFCGICLENNHPLKTVCELDYDNVKISSKLQKIAPDMELFLGKEATEKVLICLNCLEKLNEFLKFRTKCMNIIARWKSVLNTNENNVEDGNNELKLSKNHIQESANNYNTTNIKNELYSCRRCENAYSSEENLKAHLKYCKYETNLELTNNANKHKIHAILSCEICDEQYTSFKEISKHYTCQHNFEKTKQIKPYLCHQCNSRFSCLTNLKQHLFYHDKFRSEICSICGKTFKTRNDLVVHEYTHYNRRNYVCKDCGSSFNTNKNLRTHVLVVHTDQALWKYCCGVCDKKFPLKSNYEEHCRRHTGEKNYVCHICSKPFISNSELKRHVALHSNIRKYKCVPCDKEYKSKSTYRQHMNKTHSDKKVVLKEKKFVCHICPNQFYDKSKLSRHIASHSGLKPFSCDKCSKTFSDKSYLKQHLKNVHKLENNEIKLM